MLLMVSGQQANHPVQLFKSFQNCFVALPLGPSYDIRIGQVTIKGTSRKSPEECVAVFISNLANGNLHENHRVIKL